MLFVMGSTGRMGGAVLRHASGRVRAGTRLGAPADGAVETVRFDLDDAENFPDALTGCTAIFVMRPPPTTTRAPFDRLMQAAQAAGVRHVVCASVFGAGNSRVLPHIFLRPADFMQNLADVHGYSIRTSGEIAVPAGRGRSAFLDADDIGRACAAVLAAPTEHDGRGYDLTGPEALTFGEVAEVMTRVLGRAIRYRPTSIPSFVLREVRHGRAVPLALVMAALYTVQRVGRAAHVRPDLERLTGRAASGLADYVAREKATFTPPGMPSTT